jgi:tRNA pseudouridine synthase 10
MAVKLFKKLTQLLSQGYLCDHCLGRILAAQLLTGFTNEQRGQTLRHWLALLIDAGERLEIDLSNFHGIKFRQVKLKPPKPDRCAICGDFFLKEIDRWIDKVMQRLRGIEFDTFLVGSVVRDEMARAEERFWEISGVEFCEPVGAEINREIGRQIERLTGKQVDFKTPDITILINLKTGRVARQVRSLYVFGRYQKLGRGFPQSAWICRICRGAGCPHCDGRGKLYPTSVQEIIARPLLRATGATKSSFHGGGREDIMARCLGWRPFVIELVQPLRRKINLRQAHRQINRSRRVQVKGLKFVQRATIRRVKSARLDKTYLVHITFHKPIDPTKLAELRRLRGAVICQRTPMRVLHRRPDRLRRRLIKSIAVRLLGRKRLELRIRAQAGLYVRELITGDQGRTSPCVAELLNNEPTQISLDVVRIHDRGLKF